MPGIAGRMSTVIKAKISRLLDRAEDLLVKLGESVQKVPVEKRRPAGGRSMGLAFELGRGRVVVLGEAAMLSAQIAGRGMRMGFNVPGTDDRQERQHDEQRCAKAPARAALPNKPPAQESHDRVEERVPAEPRHDGVAQRVGERLVDQPEQAAVGIKKQAAHGIGAPPGARSVSDH